jgi:hypothetical protein
MLRGEATNINFIVFGLTRPGLELTIYRIRGEHANHYATDANTFVSLPVIHRLWNSPKHYYILGL